MKIFYTDVIHGEGYSLYLDSVTDKEYLWQNGILWETENAGEIKVKTLIDTDSNILIRNSLIKRED